MPQSLVGLFMVLWSGDYLTILKIIFRYLAEHLPSTPLDPLLWWKAHSLEYPNLARMAQDYLAVSGSSAPCE